MESSVEAEYAAFEEKVRRTLYIDNLSPLVTETVLRTAIDQFATVKNIQFIPNYTEENNTSRAALVELESSKMAASILEDMTKYPLMVLGMPRPVRARPAEVEMFDKRPKKPGRKIHCRWLDKSDPDFEVAKKIKDLVQAHASEASFLAKKQLEEEQKLAKQQEENLKSNYKKYELIDTVLTDGSFKQLARRYKMNITDA